MESTLIYVTERYFNSGRITVQIETSKTPLPEFESLKLFDVYRTQATMKRAKQLLRERKEAIENA